MGCCGDREKGPTKESQKWVYITLSDFKSTSAWNTPAYVWLWLLFISTIVLYAVDTFTAVNLLVFNKWSSQIQPYIPFNISKWVFAGCILFSWILWAFEWIRAFRVINRGGVAESYMDPLAVSLQSMRSQGWRRFLVFAELTKSKKGMDLVAFFTYFAFKGSIRIILAEGPRQVINTLTLIAVVKADFADTSNHSASGFGLFWFNLQQMWNKDKLQAVIIFSMIYSLLIWTISIICLASAALLYIVFLWHYIPQQDGGLASFCKRKVDKRLEKIVESKVKAGIEEEERKKRKAEERDWKAAQKAEKKGRPFDAAPVAPGINRIPWTAIRCEEQTLLAQWRHYQPMPVGPSTRNENRPNLPVYNNERPPPLRTATNGSQWTTASYESDAPLLSNAAQGGESFPTRPPTAFSRQDSNASFARQYRPPMPRPMTPGSQRSYTPAPGPNAGARPFSPMSRTDFSQNAPQYPLQRSESPYDRQNAAVTGPQYPLQRPESPYGRQNAVAGPQYPLQRPESPYGRPDMPSESPVSRSGTPLDRPAAPSRHGTTTSYDRSVPPRTGSIPFDRPPIALSRQPTAATTNSIASFSRPVPPQKFSSVNRPFTPAPAQDSNSYEMRPNPYTSKAAAGSSYVAFNPNRAASPPPQRSNSATTQDYFSHRPLATAEPQRSLATA